MVNIAHAAADLRLAPAVEAAAAKIREAWTPQERAARFAYGWRLPIASPSQEREEADND